MTNKDILSRDWAIRLCLSYLPVSRETALSMLLDSVTLGIPVALSATMRLKYAGPDKWEKYEI